MATVRRQSPDFEPAGFERTEIEGSIPERFERIVRAFSARPAVREAGRVTTYAELADAASRIRRRLMEWAGDADRPVALMLPPGAGEQLHR